MRQSLALREQMRDAIQAEIAQRTQTHQARVAGLKAARANLLAIGAAAPPKPLALLAHGDSWLIDTQGILQPLDWTNELHPYPNGFKMLAGKFIDALKLDFPGRI
ncbi:hypothetical protein [Ralstonia pseudosolanacearum]|uniref:Uncharacterized protein n=1 Tax=Ralstonia solanacearum TaxID=305 RepID=A0AA92EHL9_RALSL|nr:hypothetical protein [Ralstonia pseudosolanacearum]QCX52118.1 hypothetical protein E7Z57_24600 [Ralstonia pseudosolanacearum]